MTSLQGLEGMAPGAMTSFGAGTTLPSGNVPWPPSSYDPVGHAIKLWSAWYSADLDQLAWAYYNLGANSMTGRAFFRTTGEANATQPRPGQFRGGLVGAIQRTFHGSPNPPGEKRTKFHVPVAADIAATSSALLFARPPRLTSPDEAFQDYLDQFWTDSTHSDFLEAAEICSALGGCYLKVAWDTDVSEHPWIEVVHPDAAIPTFAGNKLVSVTFWRILAEDGDQVVRHLEQHVPGDNTISHAVYVGDQTDLGTSAPLTEFPETAPIAPMLTDGNTIQLPDQPFDASTVVYVPNLRPNRIWRHLGAAYNPLGRSDYQGVEALMDNLDEVYSSWVRDVRTAKSRLFVPNSFLDNIGKGEGAVFDEDREVYSPISTLANSDTVQAQIVSQQFMIRWQEHMNTCQQIVAEIISKAGYAGQTFGLMGEVAQTATEVEARERKSLMTRGRKILYWAPAIADLIYGYATVDKIVFGTDVTPARPTVEFQPVALPEADALAQTASTLRSAGLMSLQTGIQMAHPDWSSDQVDEEASRIYEQTGLDLALRAKISLAGPMGVPLSADVQDLTQAPVEPALPAQVPGDEVQEGN